MSSEWSPAEMVAHAVAEDEREWVPAAMPNVWMRPLLFDTVRGAWTNVVRMRTVGLVSRHAHPSPVHGFVIAGSWRYAERDWVATTGSYVFEPPGEVHTLIVPEDVSEMITFFNISGAMIYLDESGNQVFYEDVFTKIEMCRKHYAEAGLGADYIEQFIR